MSQQFDEYVDEGLFTVGDVTPRDLLYSESAWAIAPMPMDPVPGRQPPALASAARITVDEYAHTGNYGYYHGKSPGLLDYTVMNGLGIDFESQKGQKILEICAYHAHNREHSINANIKAAMLIEDWLTPEEVSALKKDRFRTTLTPPVVGGPDAAREGDCERKCSQQRWL